ncbi:MAG: integrase core domain-containing protein [Planctomycetota bacterium]|nr:integrase core domain-containing protein [Planctomycetota bacterium]
MLKRRVAAIAWRVGTGVSAETRLNEQAGSGGLIEFELAIQAGRCNRGRSRWQADAVEVGPHGTRLVCSSVPEAKVLTDAWRRHCNHRRPHRALEYMIRKSDCSGRTVRAR